MSTLQAELDRLYFPRGSVSQSPDSGESCLVAADGRVRAMVLELARPADWAVLATIWQGVQADLELPAPAIAVTGVDGYQLWFSLAESVPVAQANAFLEMLRSRYLSTIAMGRVGLMPFVDSSVPPKTVHAKLVPSQHQDTGRWSAFVASDLAAIFANEPWLDIAPNPEAQATTLSRLECIKPAAFQAAMDRPEVTGSSAPGKALDARAFLQNVMNDQTVELHLRIEAAKALLNRPGN